MNIPKQGVLHSALALAYIVAIAALMRNMSRLFEKTPEALAPVMVLSLLVVSASVMGVLMFGKPAMLYMDGKKRDAVALLLWTVGSLATCTVLLFAVAAAYYR